MRSLLFLGFLLPTTFASKSQHNHRHVQAAHRRRELTHSAQADWSEPADIKVRRQRFDEDGREGADLIHTSGIKSQMREGDGGEDQYWVHTAGILERAENVQTFTELATSCPSNGIVAQYFPYWNTVQTPSQMLWSNTDLAFFVAISTSSTGLVTASAPQVSSMKAFIKAAHANKKKALLTIGAWGGSEYFSSLVATSKSRTSFAAVISTWLSTYGFDGLSIDWEFIGAQGIGNNRVSPNDAANLLAFLKVLRAKLGTGKLISLDVPAGGIVGPSGSVLTSTSAYAVYLDYITLMDYDFYGPWSAVTGPNSPLATCNSASSSVSASVTRWIKSGFPACRILQGVPSYSHQFKTASSKLVTTTYGKTKTQAFQPVAKVQPTDPALEYTSLISQGFLSANGTKGLNGYTRYWDSCTSTPFLFNPSKSLFIAYEDATSVGLKAAYAKKMGLAGINFYDSVGATSAMLTNARAGLKGTFKASSSALQKRHAKRFGGIDQDLDSDVGIMDFEREDFGDN